MVVNNAEIEKQIAISINSREYYYYKGKPLIWEEVFLLTVLIQPVLKEISTLGHLNIDLHYISILDLH